MGGDNVWPLNAESCEDASRRTVNTSTVGFTVWPHFLTSSTSSLSRPRPALPNSLFITTTILITAAAVPDGQAFADPNAYGRLTQRTAADTVCTAHTSIKAHAMATAREITSASVAAAPTVFHRQPTGLASAEFVVSDGYNRQEAKSARLLVAATGDVAVQARDQGWRRQALTV